jgi:hypothetical protein
VNWQARFNYERDVATRPSRSSKCSTRGACAFDATMGSRIFTRQAAPLRGIARKMSVDSALKIQNNDIRYDTVHETIRKNSQQTRCSSSQVFGFRALALFDSPSLRASHLLPGHWLHCSTYSTHILKNHRASVVELHLPASLVANITPKSLRAVVT